MYLFNHACYEGYVIMQILDNGYIKLIETWGSDESIIEAARMSTNKGFIGWQNEDGTPRDLKLLEYLYVNKHHTPFEMAGMIIEVQAPIFVFREWHRHRTQSYNEMSARYVPLPDVNYIPTLERILITNTSNKQSSSTGLQISNSQAEQFQKDLEQSYIVCEAQYQIALHNGVPKELARLIIPVGRYSKMRASANLRNWLAFLTLRMEKSAQWEIRQYANGVAELIGEYFPRTYDLFIKGAK